ncbi:aldo/keto reductase [Clavibacter lycopersici]|uniref:Aldo/keto reductase n=1 Tax=Clavibacter lycopersici TaxID=2301718 RepID=A0A399TAR4_9MICO|nr:aldo/keto reductase [Clavibacter lycopersici]RIJ52092.1 aldo/keto reductase [Clavibacter lycopersici]RIJ61686.1 aldo/keto reductase [Clavibacter lycopersici]
MGDGIPIPQFGVGTYKVSDADAERIVAEALEVGYRHIDTAAMYGNEEGVGRAIRASGLPRDELFVTTKVWNDDHGRDRARDAIRRSLDRLDLPAVDLHLIHWPAAERGLFVETWEALAAAREEGLTRSIGVSNFLVPHLEALAAAGLPAPAVDQIELHPRHQQRATTEYLAEHGIAVQAWSPLARGAVADAPAVRDAAAAHGRTDAQVVLRWHVQRGTIVFPKTTRRERLIENADVFDFALTDEEMAGITALEAGGRVGSHPDQVV